MKSPFTVEELDALISACIDFTGEGDEDFYAGNIAGRQGVNVDAARVKRMMEWVAKMDTALLEDRGLGKDDIQYFRLGLAARQMMRNGGFESYLRRRRQKEYSELARLWLPITISLLSLLVSLFTALAPNDNTKRIDELSAQLSALRGDQNQTKDLVNTIRVNVDAISARLPKKTRTSNGPRG